MQHDSLKRIRIPLAAVLVVSLVVLVVVLASMRASSQRGSSILSSAYAAPVIPGLHQRHPLDQGQVGGVLLSELKCAACHTHPRLAGLTSKAAPDLSDVGRRVAPEFLRRYIADPGSVHPGTTMPQVLTAQSPEEREAIAEAITQFLVSRASAPFGRDPIDEREVERGKQLFHSVGCVACHAPREAASASGGDPLSSEGNAGLAHVSEKYSLESLSQFLHQPLDARPSGRMPDMGLDTSEAGAIASYLLGATLSSTVVREPSRELVAQGKAYFESFNCASCHQVEGIDPRPSIGLTAESGFDRGCLSPRPTRSPDFHLDDSQRAAIARALTEDPLPRGEHAQVAAVLTSFNCISCHVRDDYGGVPAAIDPFFQSSQPSLGNEARIPPRLTDVGIKLQREWLHRLMFDGARVRPYMHTRMPQFGEANLAHLVELLAEVDRGDPHEVPALTGDAARESRDAGRLLLGTDGLACISCHNFNGKDSPGFKGIDLITTTERLRPGWFARFLVSPQDHRPGIVMPQSWPGGVALRTDVLGGDTDAQIHAIWTFLAQGRTARDPVGIRSEPTVLTVTDAPRTYRGRSGIAGYRGIAVGFPGGLNYAFDAETGSMAAIWSGDFVRVRWDGQGAGGFNPAGRAVTLPRDVGLFALEAEDRAWPARPVMTEENPVNPDPLYPRRLGYQFEGYFFDEDRVPTIRYRMGEVAIHDRSVAGESGERPMLTRSIQLSTPTAVTIYLRALTGDIKEESLSEFATSDLRLTAPGVPALLRRAAEADSRDELLLRLDLAEGETTVVITYELLR